MDREYLRRFERELVDKGKLIEAGFVGLRLAAIPEDAGKTQLEEMRNAFFAGAQHLFGSIMGILDDDREPIEADNQLRQRMALLARDIEAGDLFGGTRSAEAAADIREFLGRADLMGVDPAEGPDKSSAA